MMKCLYLSFWNIKILFNLYFLSRNEANNNDRMKLFVSVTVTDIRSWNFGLSTHKMSIPCYQDLGSMRSVHKYTNAPISTEILKWISYCSTLSASFCLWFYIVFQKCLKFMLKLRGRKVKTIVYALSELTYK